MRLSTITTLALAFNISNVLAVAAPRQTPDDGRGGYNRIHHRRSPVQTDEGRGGYNRGAHHPKDPPPHTADGGRGGYNRRAQPTETIVTSTAVPLRPRVMTTEQDVCWTPGALVTNTRAEKTKAPSHH